MHVLLPFFAIMIRKMNCAKLKKRRQRKEKQSHYKRRKVGFMANSYKYKHAVYVRMHFIC